MSANLRSQIKKIKGVVDRRRFTTDRSRGDRIALDRASVRKVDADGHLHVSRTPISKANVCPYYGREIPDWQALGLDADRVYKLYRHPEELEKAAATASGKPLLFGHKPVSADTHDHDMTVGAVTAPEWAAPYLFAALDVWSGSAIKEIESGRQEQLSSAYRYRADMTPGTSQDGTRYDGVMRDIVFNHVALVPEGRAGPDVVVLDAKLPSMKDLFMTAKTPSRAAEVARGALMVYLRPKLAQDAKIDLKPLTAGLKAKSYKAQLPALLSGLKTKTAGKMAADANLDDVSEVLEALAPIIEATPDEEPDAMDDDDADLRAKLKAKGHSDDEIDRICAGPAPATDEDKDEDEKTKAMDVEKNKAAMDAAIRDAKRGMVSQTALDAALAKQKSDDRATREAIAFVEPWAGKVSVALDSAEAVHRAALDVLGIKHEGKHPDALVDIITAQPKPGDKARLAPRVAQDAAAATGFAERYPDAARIRSL